MTQADPTKTFIDLFCHNLAYAEAEEIYDNNQLVGAWLIFEQMGEVPDGAESCMNIKVSVDLDTLERLEKMGLVTTWL